MNFTPPGYWDRYWTRRTQLAIERMEDKCHEAIKSIPTTASKGDRERYCEYVKNYQKYMTAMLSELWYDGPLSILDDFDAFISK
jgi:hypothetical protein